MKKTWEQTRKEIKITESIVMFAVICILIWGGICDCLVKNGRIFIIVDDIKNISLTLLQIQAVVTTLTLTIIALLSNNVSESYMGVSVSKFYLEIRPFVLKQKVVIILEFVFLAFSVWGHLLAKYNMVIAIFMASLLLILLSILEIYSVFRGKKNSIAEIELYVSSQLDRGKLYKEVAEAFIIDWKTIISEQSSEECKKYFNLFMKCIKRSLLEEENTKNSNKMSENVALFLLNNESKMCRTRGVEFVKEYYNQIWLWIRNNQDKAEKLEGTFQLVDKVVYEWYSAIDSLDAEIVENILDWQYFSESVIRISACVGYSINQNSNESATINSMARTFGGYVAKQYKKGNIVNIKSWENLITNKIAWGIYAIPDEATDYYMQALALRDFNVCYGYLLSGQVMMVKNAIFLDDLANVYAIKYPAQVLKVMMIHCFMYYLGFRERVDCVDERLQQTIKSILLEKNVINAVNNFYYKIVANKKLISKRTEEQLELFLGQFELFPKHSNGKVMIMDRVVKEYFLFVSLMIERYFFKKEVISELLDVDKYYSYLLEPDYKNIRKKFVELRHLFERKSNNEKEDFKRVDDMLAVFDVIFKKKYKEYIIKNAASNQREYENSGAKMSIENKIKLVLREKFDSIFNNMNSSCKYMKKYDKILVFHCTDFTKWLGEDINSIYLDYPLGNFCDWLLDELKNSFGIKKVVRDIEFDNDEKFRSFLSDNKYDILLGSQYVFGCENYKEYGEHTDFLSSRKCLFIPSSHVGIACVKDYICVQLNDVIVDIYSPNLDEVEIYKDEDTGIMYYSPTSGISIDFDEKELRDFIYNERKVVKIYFSVSIGIRGNNKDGCTVVTREDFKRANN